MKIHYTQSELLNSGWTMKLIEMFLGEPDDTAPNPHYENGAPMKLYLIRKVEAIEQSNIFKSEQDKIIEKKIKRAERAKNKLPAPNMGRAKTDVPTSENKNLAAEK